MSGITELQKISEETMRFMRGKYVADEVGDGKNELKFRRGGKTILTVNIHDDRYDFLVIFGKAERAIFEEQRNGFPQNIQDIYDNSKTHHDGKWMFIPVADLDTLEAVKRLIIIKKKPNRKLLPNKNIFIGACGHRCDLCVHYKGEISISADEMKYARECVNELYGGNSPWEPNCNGCSGDACDSPDVDTKCRISNGYEKCSSCDKYFTCTKSAGWPPRIHTQIITADQVTWAILPYVKAQYGN